MNRGGPLKGEANMIDIILFVAVAVFFVGGFYCGKTFGTATAMWRKAVETVKGWL